MNTILIAYDTEDLKRILIEHATLADDVMVYEETDLMPSSGEVETVYTMLGAVRDTSKPVGTVAQLRVRYGIH